MVQKDPRADLLVQGREAAKKAVKHGTSDLADDTLAPPDQWFSTGSVALDRICRASNPGGFPSGRIIHLPGDWSTGKSLILDHLFKSCIDHGGLALCSETEGSRDPHFANAIGLDLKLLEIQRPLTIEELIDMGLAWHDSIRSKPGGKTVPIVWGIDSLDSTQASKASKGLSESHGWQYGGGRSEALGAGLRKVVQRTCRFPTTLVMLNQTRENVGNTFGPSKTTPLGEAPHFYSSLEVWLAGSMLGYQRSKAHTLKLTKEARKRLGLREQDRGDVIGRWVHAKITKTKVAPTISQETDFYIDFRKGVHRWGGLLSQLVSRNVVQISPDLKQITHGEKVFEGETPIAAEAAWLGWLSDNEDKLA